MNHADYKKRFISYLTISVSILIIGFVVMEWYKYQLFLEYIELL